MSLSIPVHHDNEESNITPEVAEPEDPAEQSGHIHPAEASTATEDSGSSVDGPVLSGDLVTLLAVTLSTPSVEVDRSTPGIKTFIPENGASSGDVPLEDIQDKVQQEGLGKQLFVSTTQNYRDADLERREHDSSECSGETSSERPEVTSQTLSMDLNEAGTDMVPTSDVKITLIPHQTLTPDWELEPSSAVPQESRSDPEYSAEPPVTAGSDNISKEQNVTAEITSSSFNGEFTENEN